MRKVEQDTQDQTGRGEVENELGSARETDRERDDGREKTITTEDERVDERLQEKPAQKRKNKQEGEGDGSGCQGGGREQSFHSLSFHFVLANTRRCGHLSDTLFLSCQYVLQKYNCGG